jgi:hypothetical protein
VRPPSFQAPGGHRGAARRLRFRIILKGVNSGWFGALRWRAERCRWQQTVRLWDVLGTFFWTILDCAGYQRWLLGEACFEAQELAALVARAVPRGSIVVPYSPSLVDRLTSDQAHNGGAATEPSDTNSGRRQPVRSRRRHADAAIDSFRRAEEPRGILANLRLISGMGVRRCSRTILGRMTVGHAKHLKGTRRWASPRDKAAHRIVPTLTRWSKQKRQALMPCQYSITEVTVLREG